MYLTVFSWFLISFFKGGGNGPSRAIKFLMHMLLHPAQYGPWNLPRGLLCNYDLIYTALRIMFWKCAYPLLGQVGGGWALEISSFLGRKLHCLLARCHFTGPKKLSYVNSLVFLAITLSSFSNLLPLDFHPCCSARTHTLLCPMPRKLFRRQPCTYFTPKYILYPSWPSLQKLSLPTAPSHIHSTHTFRIWMTDGIP